MDTFTSIGFIQQVETPTRGNNVLDIYAMNSPALIHSMDVIPVISDHETIRVSYIQFIATFTQTKNLFVG